MKFSKSGLLPKVFLIAGIIVAMYFLNELDEGFQGSSTVDLFLKLNTSAVPTIVINSTASNPVNRRVTLVSATNGAMTLSIPSALGPLQRYTAKGFTVKPTMPQGYWQDISANQIDRGGTSFRMSTGSGANLKIIHNPDYTPPNANTRLSPNEWMLPRVVSPVIINGISQGNFSAFKSEGDPNKAQSIIHVQLQF